MQTAVSLTAGLLVTALAAAPAGALTPYPGQKWQPGEARYGALTEDVTITLKDGTRLAGQLARPADKATGARAEGNFPVIVEFTPYLGLAQPVVPNDYLTAHGYIYAVVRPRGTGGSTGEVQQFTSQDGRDGAEVVDWAAGLDGSDGRVGMLGCSYPGATGLATAAEVGPGSPLKAVVAACIGLDMQHRQVWTTNGLPNAALSSYAPAAGVMMGESATGYFTAFSKGVLAGGPEAYDGYWSDRLPLSRAAKIVANDVPTLLWTGWSDINEIGGVHAYLAMQNAAAGRDVWAPVTGGKGDPRFQIVVGDWAHGQGLDSSLYLEWFETWLKGVDTGLQTTAAPMHVFEKGSGRWLNLIGYPLTDASVWHLGDGALAQAGTSGEVRLAWGDPETADGKLTFTSPPFADGATLAGPLSVGVRAASSNTNLELIANLYDVSAEGAETRIAMGAILGSQSRLDEARSWRDSNGILTWPWPQLLRDEYLAPGEARDFHIFLGNRQWGIAPGHSLRLTLTTQSPASVCPAEGEVPMLSEPCRLTAPQQQTLPGGIYTIDLGNSALNLPLLPYRAFPEIAAGPAPAAWDETNRRTVPATTTLPLDWGGR